MNGCFPNANINVGKDSLERVVADYIKCKREKARRESRYYVIQRDLARAVEKAASCTRPDWKRHRHQRRIPSRCLTKVNEKLQKRLNAIAKATTFEDIYELVNCEIKPIRGIGDLTVYDIAHGIGAFCKLEPELVYLHAGTLAGARALGVDCKSRKLDMNRLPGEFHLLQPYEVEDCLCIYRPRIERIFKRRGPRSS